MKKILLVFGTRPEAIKLAPLVKFLKNTKEYEVETCSTGQHREMLQQVIDFFGLKLDYSIDVMKPNQTLTDLTSSVLIQVKDILDKSQPDLVIVQGDTTTAFASALAAFYSKIPVAHVEAGLRTNNLYSPWPEELNRQLISRIAQIHFAPTQTAKDNLIKEGVDSRNVIVTGNTVIDALFDAYDLIDANVDLTAKLQKKFPFLNTEKKVILVTGHRRENFGKGFEEICKAIKEISQRSDALLVYPVHLNPNVQGPVRDHLSNSENIILLSPLDYPSFLYLMRRAYLILTDSGGVQEEAPSIGKPVIVMRDTTERPEAVLAGTVLLSGADASKIKTDVNMLLDDSTKYKSMSKAINPYGDGKACLRIFDSLKKFFG